MSSLFDRVVALGPALSARAEAAENERRLPAETIAELGDAGLFRALVPRSFGGDERSIHEVHAAIITMATSCSSTAWVSSLLAIHALGIAWFDEAAQREVWRAGPDTLVVSSVAPTGAMTRAQGGFELSGRWSFVSGADHGQWALVGATIRSEKDAPYFLLLVPASDLTIEDDWHVAGLKATGSKSIVLDKVFVPEHRALSRARMNDAARRVHDAPTYRMSWKGVFDSAFPPVAIGTALANISGFEDYVSKRVHVFSGADYKSSAGSLVRLAEAAAQVESVRLLYTQGVRDLEASAGLDEAARKKLEARLSYDFAFTIDRSAYAVARLFRGSGGKALHAKSPLQRHFRDIHAMTQHAACDLDILGPAYGAARLVRS